MKKLRLRKHETLAQGYTVSVRTRTPPHIHMPAGAGENDGGQSTGLPITRSNLRLLSICLRVGKGDP